MLGDPVSSPRHSHSISQFSNDWHQLRDPAKAQQPLLEEYMFL